MLDTDSHGWARILQQGTSDQRQGPSDALPPLPRFYASTRPRPHYSSPAYYSLKPSRLSAGTMTPWSRCPKQLNRTQGNRNEDKGICQRSRRMARRRC
jgi:hypothetical protein